MFYYSYLDPTLQKALKNHELSPEELSEVYESMKKKQAKKNKIFFIVCIAALVFLIAWTIYIQVTVGELSSIPIVAVVLVVLLALGWCMNIGIVRLQFNGAVKKGYPDIAQQYKL